MDPRVHPTAWRLNASKYIFWFLLNIWFKFLLKKCKKTNHPTLISQWEIGESYLAGKSFNFFNCPKVIKNNFIGLVTLERVYFRISKFRVKIRAVGRFGLVFRGCSASRRRFPFTKTFLFPSKRRPSTKKSLFSTNKILDKFSKRTKK